MKAAIHTKYGPPDVIEIREIENPVPGDNEILIRIMAATVNRTDCAILWGKPLIMRLLTGLFKPKSHFTGTDFAGNIEAVGKNVTAFKPGERVWGFDDNGLGSHAQFITISEKKAIIKIPKEYTYEQAAASAEGAHYAVNFINKVELKAGHKVLVNGASGAIGSAAVQILKSIGVIVTAVCDTKNLELLKSLGANKIIDYTRENFINDKDRYDYIFDAVGKSTFFKCKPLLKPNGIYISSELGPGAQNLFLALITPLFGGKKVIFPFPSNIKNSLTFIHNLIERKKFSPVIEKTYPIEKISDAFYYVSTGKKTGNVLIKINPE